MISRDCRTPRGSHARPFARPFARLPAPCPPPHPPPHTHTRHGPVRSSALLVRHLTPHSQQQPQRLRQRMQARGANELWRRRRHRRRRRSSEEGEGQGGEQRRRLSVSLSHSLFGAEASVLVVIRIHGGCLAHTMCTVFATQRQQRHESQRMVSELPVRSQRLSLMWLLYSPQNVTRKDVFHTTTASLSAPAARWPCAPCPSGGGGAVPCVGYQPLVAGGC